MLTDLVFKLSSPTINFFPDNREHSQNYTLMKEETSLFENLMNQMKSSKKPKSSSCCSNPNCKYIFMTYSPCSFCTKNFCNNCLCKCGTCDASICKFCSTIKYEKYQDLILCPDCFNLI